MSFAVNAAHLLKQRVWVFGLFIFLSVFLSIFLSSGLVQGGVDPVPQPSSEPSAVPESTPSPAPRPEPNGGYGYLGIVPQVFVARLSGQELATGVSSQLSSGLGYSTAVRWTQVHTRKIRTVLRLTLTQVEFDSNAEIQVSHNPGIYRKLEAGVELRSGASSRVLLGLEVGESVFLRPNSVGTIFYTLDRVYITGVNVGWREAIFRENGKSIGFEPKLGVLFPGSTKNFSIGFGLNYGARVFVEYVPPRTRLGLNLGMIINQTRQSTALMGQLRTDYGVEGRLDWSFNKY